MAFRVSREGRLPVTSTIQRPKRLLFLYFCWSLVALLLWKPACFGLKKESLGSVRERAGKAQRIKVADSYTGPQVTLTESEKILLSQIARAAESRDWTAAKSLYQKYTGSAEPIVSATMNAAFRCRKYQEGAFIYEKCKERLKVVTHTPVLALAMKIYGKLGDKEEVRMIWSDALKFDLDQVLASARITAASYEGDVETAAAILDDMNTAGIPITIVHVNAAMKACWGWKAKGAKAARYFFDLLPGLGLEPDLITFTVLIGAYEDAKLQDILSAFAEMKALEIRPDAAFAETYLTAILQMTRSDRKEDWRRIDVIQRILRDKEQDRLKAAENAFTEFSAASVKLTTLSTNIQKALRRL